MTESEFCKELKRLYDYPIAEKDQVSKIDFEALADKKQQNTFFYIFKASPHKCVKTPSL